METVAIIIITAIVNAIITGIVSNVIFYRYQKKIENSFAKEMKEFETNLQKSLFDYQTKTAISYPKKVETLGNLHRKFWSYANRTTNLNNRLLVWRNGFESLKENDYSIYADEWQEIWKLLDDFHTYFETNRFFLSPDTVDEIGYIYEKARSDCSYLSFPVKNEDENARKRWLQQIELSKMNFNLEMWTKDLEKIYRSAIEVISQSNNP